MQIANLFYNNLVDLKDDLNDDLEDDLNDVLKDDLKENKAEPKEAQTSTKQTTQYNMNFIQVKIIRGIFAFVVKSQLTNMTLILITVNFKSFIITKNISL